MFWSDWGEEPKIERAGMDGSNRTVIVKSHIFWPNGLTIDYKDKRIYWTDAKMNHIESTNYNGKRQRNVVRRSLPHPFALSLYGNKLYWTDWTTRAIHSCNKNTGHGMQNLKSSIESPMDILVYEQERQMALSSSKCALIIIVLYLEFEQESFSIPTLLKVSIAYALKAKQALNLQ